MKKVYFLPLLLLLSTLAFSQEKFTSKEVRGAEANAIWQGAEHIWLKQENTVPAFIQFRAGSEPDEETFFFTLRKTFSLPSSYSFSLINDESDQSGWQHKRFRLAVNNVPVANGVFILHLVDGKVRKYNGYLFKNISVNTSASVSETSALDFVLRNVNAQTYKWQLAEEESFLRTETGDVNATHYPKGELEILQLGKNESNNFRLAWKFDIYAHQPMSRDYVYVDAQTGEVLKKSTRIHHANTNGTATTVYRGNRAIVADSYNGSYRLRETTRGLGIRTYNMQTGTSYGNSVDFTDANNFWNNVNANLDQYAGDGHWGAEMTYDFYSSMGRNSIDNAGYALYIYMHYDVSYVNAFWDGTRMTFGDGNSSYDPLVSLDITGHEISHGLTERTSNLDYQDESGALNESFSDIFGAAVEWYADSTVANWLIGEDIGGAFRSMSNPNSYGDPDTYFGTNWYTGTGDNGGVHTNSSVQNHWYYRLSQGGSGTNDIGNAYNVTGIGRNKATRIAWRTDVNYLTSTSDYADSRFYSIQSANDLYGVCSPEAIATTKAWYAVGVGGDFVYGADAQFTASPLSGCTVPFSVNFTNASTNATSYTWTFGDGGTSTALNPSYTYNTLGTYTVKLVSNGGACGIDSLTKTNYININAINPCVVIMPNTGSYQTQTACAGTIYDNGGTGNYTDNTNSTVTIAPTGASQVRLHFTQFNMEASYDYLYVYDGPTIASPVIGSYTGTTIPADILSSGSSITIRQYTDPGVVASGFTIQWTCINPNSPPVANFKADVTQSCSGSIKFTDLSTGGPSSWLWNFGDGTTSTAHHPNHSYIASGTYTVSLVATNAFGNNTMTKANYIVVSKPPGPSVTNQSGCGPQSFTLNLSDVNPVTWFDTAGNVIANGNPFVTPMLNSTTTYYVQDTQPQPIYHVGPLSNAIGSGNNYNSNQTRALRFRVFKNSKLISVYVYAQGAGYRTIQYRDSLGGVITNKMIYVPNGASRIYVNIDLMPGGPYELGLKDTMNLYRNSTGAVYPYNDANGIVSIIGNNAANSAAYYYFFYDWEVKETDCISQRVPVVATINPLVSVTPNTTNVSCFGGSNGTASITPGGGTPSFTYHWSSNSTTASISNLQAGTYTVTATDAVGCSATASIAVSQPTALIPSSTVTNILCNGTNTGAINLNVTGGTAGYSYNWGGGITSQNRTSLAAGIYVVTVTDANSCTTSSTTTVTQPPAILSSTVATNVLCNGGNTGAVNLNVTGGTPGYMYNWGGGITTQNRTSLAAGTYTVTITDVNSCTNTASATVTQQAAISTSTTITNVPCNGENTGAINLNVTGGTTGYAYNWGGGIVSQNRTSLTAGTYSVTITDANSCSVTASAVVAQPTPLSPVTSVTNVLCNGANTGAVNLNVTGGVANYTYNWGGGVVTQNRTSLTAGTYIVTVTDANSCTVTASATVSEPVAINVNVTASNALCGQSNGSVSAIVSGGTPNYSYTWSNGANTASISNLNVGSYSVTVNDNNGCSSTGVAPINNSGSITAAASSTNVNCFGSSDGTVTANVNSGTQPYTYVWSNGATTSSISGLSSGVYSATVTDAAGCVTIVTQAVSEPGALSVSVVSTDATCGFVNGNAIATVTGGTSAYSYLWSNTAATSSISGLAAGNYSVTITDAHNCTTTNSVIVNNASSIVASISATDVSCNGGNDGTASLNVTGGIQPVTYVWSNGSTSSSITNLSAGDYFVTTTDGNNCIDIKIATVTEPAAITLSVVAHQPDCNGEATGSASVAAIGGNSVYSFAWSNSAIGNTISNLAAGSYSVTALDGNNCSAVSGLVLTEPVTLSVNTIANDVLCSGDQNGNAVIFVSGGTPGYSYQWCNGSVVASVQNLSPGDCAVTVTDDNGCSVTSIVQIAEPAPIQFATSTSNANIGVSDGSILVSNLTGGSGAYSFIWNNGDTTQNLVNVSGGTYSITVADGNGCTETATVIVQENPSGMNSPGEEVSVNVYPNPAFTEVFVTVSRLNKGALLRIKNALGQTLHIQPLTSTQTKIDLSLFPSGLYILELNNGEKIRIQELVISR